ncbi:hypothetical protein FLP10_14380 [Agromyces intestinalis]|uniref:Uncharacterized protein n=1 Tax=Agromyces intestinalis TaxID=2592652 RepID=A0A5C1YL04_9MICO|nr:DUF6264 family protein [Agromyces intestinalis]QEO15482.1 hypothetical protein FLP10_14380 [Agromyces intestinalis]
MSQDEAARTPDTPAPGGATPPPAPEPVDERPRPQFGEYAPPGWTWTPPEETRHEAAAPAAAAPAVSGAAAAAAPTAAGRAVHPTDRAWTIALLAFGVLGVIYNSFSLAILPDSVVRSAQLSAAMLGMDAPTSFTPGPAVPALIAIGIALQLALWVGALLWSRARMRAGLIAWWVPLIAGVAAFIVVTIIGMLVFASDPVFFSELTTPRQ